MFVRNHPKSTVFLRLDTESIAPIFPLNEIMIFYCGSEIPGLQLITS